MSSVGRLSIALEAFAFGTAISLPLTLAGHCTLVPSDPSTSAGHCTLVRSDRYGRISKAVRSRPRVIRPMWTCDQSRMRRQLRAATLAARSFPRAALGSRLWKRVSCSCADTTDARRRARDTSEHCVDPAKIACGGARVRRPGAVARRRSLRNHQGLVLLAKLVQGTLHHRHRAVDRGRSARCRAGCGTGSPARRDRRARRVRCRCG